MKHCNISKYLFPFEGVEMQCVTLPYSFAMLFLFSLNHFLNVTLAVLVPLKFCFLGWIYNFLKEYLLSFTSDWSKLVAVLGKEILSLLPAVRNADGLH